MLKKLSIHMEIFNVIYEHEIPKGSRLYFGKTANAKRELEYTISKILLDENFEEIVTPNFSYSHHQSIDDQKKLIILSDESNNQIALRADSTLDVVRIITKRLGRTTSHRKWFYIQPVFTYPTNENYQIGLEWIDHNNIADVVNLSIKILSNLKIDSIVQLSNINIPKLVAAELNIDIDLFKNGEIAKLFDLNIEWLNKLLYVQDEKALVEAIELVPQSLKFELNKLLEASKSVSIDVKIAPLFYGSMKYYDDIYFTIFGNNELLAKGGKYTSEGISSLGFAFYTDNLLKNLED